MSQGTAFRALFSVLAGVLFALQLFSPSTPAATGHERHIASTDAELVRAANCGDAHPVETVAHPVYARDRQRAAQFSTQGPPHGVESRDPAASAVPASRVPAGTSHRLPRPATGRTPAVLQVFRC
ncbi:hypothetical protein [Streptomyces jeddahensis]|uniref:Secreted protein n=1 Tax=Streptomyces jeddahensis TaxID=1716141 RepID=A0A177HPT2_9ACTN|nr:hypothetical protein [Streptomyces jeddahensis]OAH12204.1 hypothetical protein STSP_43990 [Streptomyces jeddahensis]